MQDRPSHSRSAALIPSAALVLGTVFWGLCFLWAKEAGDAVNRTLGLGSQAMLGPVYVTAWRFLMPGLAWLLLFPSSRTGWSWISLGRGALLGLITGVATLFQMLGLDRTDEATSAFLTSLTILFVPLICALILRRPPPKIMWIGIVLATLGIWLLTMAGHGGHFGWGESFGLVCAMLFSVQILAINAIVPRDTASRMAAGQFIFCALICFAVCLFIPAGPRSLHPASTLALFRAPGVGLNLALLSIFPGLMSFGLLMHFQPKLDASRAALIYLMEPVFTAFFAWSLKGRSMTLPALAGAALILLANALVEILNSRSEMKRKTQQPRSPNLMPA